MFNESVDSPAEQLRETMGGAFETLLESNRNEMLLVMTAFTTPEPEIRDYVRAEFDEVYEQVNKRFTEAGFDDPENKAREFIANGLVITLAEVLQLPKLFPWCKS
ncbi:hypothetical protein J9303_12765 [Bacillaceae bacterium Marseille-Q3522]|nr:hypothetical protein [Bacillaceae bacterium Marseille-Q3522]